VTSTSFAFIIQMLQLRELDFDLHRMSPATRTALLASSAAGHFAHISHLSLTSGDLESDALATLLAGFPQLNCLMLWLWNVLNSLRFLATDPLAASLTCLHIICCPALPLEELEHVHGLKHLLVLDLDESFTAPLPLYVERLFTPGNSLVLPELEHFSCEPPSRN
jgi:hypothetical protein